MSSKCFSNSCFKPEEKLDAVLGRCAAPCGKSRGRGGDSLIHFLGLGELEGRKNFGGGGIRDLHGLAGLAGEPGAPNIVRGQHFVLYGYHGLTIATTAGISKCYAA